MPQARWQLELGARVVESDRVRFSVWSPDANDIEVEIYPPPEGVVRYAMQRDQDGLWSADVECSAGTLYRYRLNNDWGYPDPFSRSQPEGVHGPSQVIDTAKFQWADMAWRGLDVERLAIYELHVGAYTAEGTFHALIDHLDDLRELGVTAIELMPVAEFPGRRNWGYDGVDLFAPSSVYGGPFGLQRLVDAAHERGLGIILDVVYNHLGPDGNYLRSFATDYFTDRYQTPWGDAINFDGENSRWVRRFFVDNALYWLHEYHVDGLRLDATHHIFDQGGKHVVQELVEAVRDREPVGRRSLIIAEDERNDLRLVLPRVEGGYGLDAMWVDDFHHSVHVLLTGEAEGYLGSYGGTAEEVARLLRVGYLYPRPPRAADEGPVGVAPNVPAHQLVYCIQNHDQVGNRPMGERLSHVIDLESYKAACALLMLSPCTPLIFMGDEFAASAPFLYFTEHETALAALVTAGRAQEFKEFWQAQGDRRTGMPDPQDESTFQISKLAHEERDRVPQAGVLRLFRELLRTRRADAVLRAWDRWRMLAEAVGDAAVAVERWDEDGRRRLLVVNFGEALDFVLDHQAWMGKARELMWRAVLCSAEARYSGPGVDLVDLTLEPGEVITLPAHSATRWTSQE
jgi:maltooligosyltrehalose trehalohydrolase